MTVTQIFLITLILLLFSGLLAWRVKPVFSFNQKMLLVLAPLVIMAITALLPAMAIGGTVRYAKYGWPHFFYFYQIEDILDKTPINQGHLVPGPFFSYVIADYLFYFSIALLVLIIVEHTAKSRRVIDKKMTQW